MYVLIAKYLSFEKNAPLYFFLYEVDSKDPHNSIKDFENQNNLTISYTFWKNGDLAHGWQGITPKQVNHAEELFQLAMEFGAVL